VPSLSALAFLSLFGCGGAGRSVELALYALNDGLHPTRDTAGFRDVGARVMSSVRRFMVSVKLHGKSAFPFLCPSGEVEK
jgi:hypothetical protein